MILKVINNQYRRLS